MSINTLSLRLCFPQSPSSLWPSSPCLLLFHSAKSHSLPDIHTQPRFSKHMDPFSVVHTLIELIGAIDAHSTSPKSLARSLKALKDKLTSTRGLLVELEELVKAETSDITSSPSHGFSVELESCKSTASLVLSLAIRYVHELAEQWIWKLTIVLTRVDGNKNWTRSALVKLCLSPSQYLPSSKTSQNDQLDGPRPTQCEARRGFKQIAWNWKMHQDIIEWHIYEMGVYCFPILYLSEID